MGGGCKSSLNLHDKHTETFFINEFADCVGFLFVCLWFYVFLICKIAIFIWSEVSHALAYSKSLSYIIYDFGCQQAWQRWPHSLISERRERITNITPECPQDQDICHRAWLLGDTVYGWRTESGVRSPIQLPWFSNYKLVTAMLESTDLYI